MGKPWQSAAVLVLTMFSVKADRFCKDYLPMPIGTVHMGWHGSTVVAILKFTICQRTGYPIVIGGC